MKLLPEVVIGLGGQKLSVSSNGSLWVKPSREGEEARGWDFQYPRTDRCG